MKEIKLKYVLNVTRYMNKTNYDCDLQTPVYSISCVYYFNMSEYSTLVCTKTEEDDCLSKFIFSDETAFHMVGIVNRHNCWIWGSSPPTEFLEHDSDIPQVNVWCAPTSTEQ
jgi:hypothetical protein